jgi:hypothetical protein
MVRENLSLGSTYSNFQGRPVSHDSDHIAVTDPDSPYALDDSTMWATGSWTLTVQPKGENPIPLNGCWSTIYSREGNLWKEKMQTWNISPGTT